MTSTTTATTSATTSATTTPTIKEGCLAPYEADPPDLIAEPLVAAGKTGAYFEYVIPEDSFANNNDNFNFVVNTHGNPDWASYDADTATIIGVPQDVIVTIVDFQANKSCLLSEEGNVSISITSSNVSNPSLEVAVGWFVQVIGFGRRRQSIEQCSFKEYGFMSASIMEAVSAETKVPLESLSLRMNSTTFRTSQTSGSICEFSAVVTDSGSLSCLDARIAADSSTVEARTFKDAITNTKYGSKLPYELGVANIKPEISTSCALLLSAAEPENDDESASLWWIVLVVLVLVIILIGLVYRKRNKPQEPLNKLHSPRPPRVLPGESTGFPRELEEGRKPVYTFADDLDVFPPLSKNTPYHEPVPLAFQLNNEKVNERTKLPPSYRLPPPYFVPSRSDPLSLFDKNNIRSVLEDETKYFMKETTTTTTSIRKADPAPAYWAPPDYHPNNATSRSDLQPLNKPKSSSEGVLPPPFVEPPGYISEYDGESENQVHERTHFSIHPGPMVQEAKRKRSSKRDLLLAAEHLSHSVAGSVHRMSPQVEIPSRSRSRRADLLNAAGHLSHTLSGGVQTAGLHFESSYRSIHDSNREIRDRRSDLLAAAERLSRSVDGGVRSARGSGTHYDFRN